MKKTGIIFLVLCLMLLFCACDSTGTLSSADTSAGSETIPETCIYTIVRCDNSNSEEKNAAIRLRDTLKETYQLDVKLVTDWYSERDTTTKEHYGNEIEFGSTNREASEDCMARLHEGTVEMNDYIIDTTDTDYVIVASEGHAEEAVDAFLTLVAQDPSILGKEPDSALATEVKHEFPSVGYTLYGKPVSDYTAIVIPDKSNKGYLKDAQALSDKLFAMTGTSLPVVGENESYTAPVIRYGDRSNADVQSAGGFSYAIESSDEGILLGGTDFYTDWCAYDILLRGIEENEDGFSGTEERIAPIDANRLILSAWVISSAEITEESQFEEIAECGYNQVIISKPSNEDTLNNFCKWMAKYELQALWSDSALNVGAEEHTYADYVFSPVTWGHMLKDEPNESDFSALAEFTKEYEETASGKVGFVNLFPNYANTEQLGTSSYKKYVEDYLDTVQPTFLSVDIYPLNTGSVIDNYFENLSVFCNACRERNIPYALYIQSVSFNSTKRNPTETGMRWQSYCGLSFGVTDIEYFTYRTPDSSTEDFKSALIDRDNAKTDAWYGAQKVNAELNALSPVFMRYSWLGAYAVNGDATFQKFNGQYKDFSAIGSVEVSSDDAVLIGCFEETDGDGYAFTCVNMDDPDSKMSHEETVTVEIPDGRTAIVYRSGIASGETVTDGTLVFTLAVGEGVFVTLD